MPEYRVSAIDVATNEAVLIPASGVQAGVTSIQSGRHSFANTGTGLSPTYTVTFPQAFANAPAVELTYQWNYNASTNGSALSPGLLLEGVTTTGFSYRINGGRNTLDRVMWTATDPVTVATAGTVIATPYNITVNSGANGSFTGHEAIGPETFYLTMPADQEIDAFPTIPGVTLRNRQAGIISVDRAAGTGDLAITGVTFRAMAPNAQYFGTWNDQAGDSTATNGGHTCTRRILRGTGITTSNDSVLTLSGGIYKVRVGIPRHFAYGAWRATSLLVDGTAVDSTYSGHDGGNWPGSGVIEWIVDATAANRTIQVRRTSSTGNGNCSGFLSVERVAAVAAPEGTVLYTPRVITGTNVVAPGARDNTVTTVRVTGVTAGSEVTAATATGGATVTIRDSGKGGTAYLDVIPNGADTAIAVTQTVWRRTIAEAGGALINGAASQNIDATSPYSSAIAIPAGQFLQGLTATNATVVKFAETGAFTISPTNAGNVVLTATFAAASANDYIHVHATADQTTGLTIGSPVLFSSPTVQNSAGCSFSAGVFTLPANKTFRLTSQITWATGTEVIVRWRNITANTLIGGSANVLVSGRGCTASAVISTTQVTTVRLEIVYVSGLTGFYSDTGRGSWAYIEEITRTVLSAPTNTTLFTPRSITGSGITTVQGRDNTVSTIAVTGIVAGSEVTAVTRTGGSTVSIQDSGRGGTAYLDVIPNGSDTDITVTQTVWRRAMTATVNGAAANVNGASSATVDATKSIEFYLTLPAGQLLNAAPTVTGGTLTSWNANGVGTITPTNAGNITITATATVAKIVPQWLTAGNRGTWVTVGTIQVAVTASGNAQMVMRSTTGTITVNTTSCLTWDSNRHAFGQSINASSTYGPGQAGWNFTAVDQVQDTYVNDTTNNRSYFVRMVVQSSHNNQRFFVYEL